MCAASPISTTFPLWNQREVRMVMNSATLRAAYSVRMSGMNGSASPK